MLVFDLLVKTGRGRGAGCIGRKGGRERERERDKVVESAGERDNDGKEVKEAS